MALATWWNSDPLPDPKSPPGFRAKVMQDAHLISGLNRLPLSEVVARQEAGHRPYVAFRNDTPVAYGWVATESASIGELGLSFRLPAEERYLWDFATIPSAQGRGYYPRLLHTILSEESRFARRFWIIFAPENLPSGAGIRRSGFSLVGQLSFLLEGGTGLAVFKEAESADLRERAAAGANLLGVPLVEKVLSPCWCCGSLVSQQPSITTACWPPVGPNSEACTCAISIRPAASDP